MTHCALNVTILAAVVKAIGLFESQHIAIVTRVLRNLFMNIAAYNLCFACQRMLAERMLCIEGNGDCVVHTIVTGEVPRWCLMTAMFCFHKVPSIVSICTKRPSSQIGLQRTATIERGIGVCIILTEIKETVDAAIDGGSKFLRYDLPLVVGDY